MSQISEVHNIDCMEYMRGLPDKFFELAIVDPPYGLKHGSRGNGDYVRRTLKYTSKTDKKWDENIPNRKYFKELFRVSQNQIIWGANYMVEHIPASMGWICWYKSDEIKGRDFSECEFAFSSFDKAARHFDCKPFIKKIDRIHSTQKPIVLYKWLLQNYAKQGDKILDTHLGSGSSRIAAFDMGFDFYATELDKDYYEAQEKRFKEHCIAHGNVLFKPERQVIQQQKLL